MPVLSRRDFDRMLSASVAARVEEADRRIAAALCNLEAESRRAEEAEARASMAERAKIDLTLSLALTDASDDGEGTSRMISSLSRSSQRHSIAADGAPHPPHFEHMLGDLDKRIEEAELAAAVQVSQWIRASRGTHGAHSVLRI